MWSVVNVICHMHLESGGEFEKVLFLPGVFFYSGMQCSALEMMCAFKNYVPGRATFISTVWR